MSKENKVDLTKYIVNVSGKDFITFPGLLALAHEKGLTSIETQLVNEDLTNPVIRSVVKFGDKTFTGYGDANVNNVAKKVAGALLRMAETRSLARALRFGCNVDMAALEELDGDDNVISSNSKAQVKVTAPGLKAPTVTEAAASVTTPAAPVKEQAVQVNNPFSKKSVIRKPEPRFP